LFCDKSDYFHENHKVENFFDSFLLLIKLQKRKKILDLTYLQFPKITFQKNIFDEKGVDFYGCKFYGDTVFKNLKFKYSTCICSCQVVGKATFENLVFHKKANFCFVFFMTLLFFQT